VEDGSLVVCKAENCSGYARADLNIVGVVNVGVGAVATGATRGTVCGEARAIDDHRKRSERQRQPEDAQAMTCKWPLRQTVRDFPLHHIPQSHSQCQPGAIAVAIRASTD